MSGRSEPGTRPAGLERRFVVGLGNPGIQYADTRHNAGFRVIERLWRRNPEAPYQATAALQFQVTGADRFEVVLGRPRTFMNLSGAPVATLLGMFGGRPDELLVVHDDLDLPVGALRFRRGGSSGGHRGVASILETLGPDGAGFARLKIGVGRPGGAGGSVVDFVLTPARGEDAARLTEAESVAAAAAWLWISDGIDRCMSRFNRKEARAEEG